MWIRLGFLVQISLIIVTYARISAEIPPITSTSLRQVCPPRLNAQTNSRCRCQIVFDVGVILNVANYTAVAGKNIRRLWGTLVMLMLNLSDRLAFVAIRIHALWSRNRYILVSLFLLGMINPATIVTVRSPFLCPPPQQTADITRLLYRRRVSLLLA